MMKRLLYLGWAVFMLVFFSSCYSYRDVTTNEDIVNQKANYRVTIPLSEKKGKRVKVDSVYWANDSLWVLNEQHVIGMPAEGIRVEERKVNWWKTIPLFTAIAAIVAVGVVEGANGLISFEIPKAGN